MTMAPSGEQFEITSGRQRATVSPGVDEGEEHAVGSRAVRL
jgi:hypothetical protein